MEPGRCAYLKMDYGEDMNIYINSGFHIYSAPVHQGHI